MSPLGWPGHVGEIGIASLDGVIPLILVYDAHSVLDGHLSRLYKICYRS